LRRSAFLASALLIAGCALQGATGAATAFATETAGTFKTLYDFKNGLDGRSPLGPLLSLNGSLYGVTEYGGNQPGAGTVFEMSRTGAYRELHRFDFGRTDGAYPQAGLAAVGAFLYGAAESGGASGAGCVFRIAATGGRDGLVYSFKTSGGDGQNPLAGLAAVNGTLYGTTANGGSERTGTVFAITPGGSERVLHDFAAATDGYDVVAPLVAIGDTLYGTAQHGGAHHLGTVFAMTTLGRFRTLYAFTGGADGANPRAALLPAGDELYGTAPRGGTHGDGTLFAVNASSGALRIVHEFGPLPDCAGPDSGVTALGGSLYGTTAGGGSRFSGTLYRATPTGSESVLYDFAGAALPSALVSLGGTLYGATLNAGTDGAGSIFAFAP
jgi:uncharacterized repeat protein (TIGR03803 family)